MSPAVKYTLGRIGLFVVVLLALWPVQLNIYVKLMLALVFSAALSFFLLRGWRNEMAQQMADAARRRQAERERLRAALSGEDETRAEPARGERSEGLGGERSEGPGGEPPRGPATR